MEYTKGELRVEITSIVKSHTLCEDGEALGASGNIIEIPIIKAALAMYEALKAMPKYRSEIGEYAYDLALKALAKAEGK